jgi:hypothetical protein
MKIRSRKAASLSTPTVLALAGLLAVSGCSATQTTARPPGQSSASDAETILTTTATSLRQEWDIGTAQQELVATCMASKGYRYITTSQGPEPGPRMVTADATATSGPATYGVALQALAAGATQTGQGSTAGVTAQDSYVESLPTPVRARYADAYGGALLQGLLSLPGGLVIRYATGGCLGQARTELFGSVRAAILDTLAPQDIGNAFGGYLASDQPYQQALRTWQGCMAAAGWHVESPQAAIQSIEFTATQNGTTIQFLNRRQTAVATADVRCDRTSQLRARWRQQLAVFVGKQPRQNIDLLRSTFLTRQQAVHRALKVL